MTYLMAGVLADVSKPSVAITIAGAAGLGLIGVVQIFWPTSAMRAALDQAYATNGYEQDPSASDTQERASAGERELVPEKAVPAPTSAPPQTFPSGDFWDAFRP